MFPYLLFQITKENTHISMCLKDSYQDLFLAFLI